MIRCLLPDVAGDRGHVLLMKRRQYGNGLSSRDACAAGGMAWALYQALGAATPAARAESTPERPRG